jgi:hypothetical protein
MSKVLPNIAPRLRKATPQLGKKYATEILGPWGGAAGMPAHPPRAPPSRPAAGLRRHPVGWRGTRSKRGSQPRMVLQSLVATWDLRGQDSVAEFLRVLTTPAHSCPEIAPL